MNNYPENQHSYGRNSSASQIVIFRDSIPCDIKLREFNYWLSKGYAQMKSFPGGTSKVLLYYVKTTLKNKKLKAALLHVGANDLPNDESQDSVQNLLRSLKQIGLISGIAVNNKLTSAYISYVNQRISNMCRDNHLSSLTTITFPHQVSFTMVYTCLKLENVF